MDAVPLWIKLVSMAAVFLFFALGGHEFVATWWRRVRGKDEEDVQ